MKARRLEGQVRLKSERTKLMGDKVVAFILLCMVDGTLSFLLLNGPSLDLLSSIQEEDWITILHATPFLWKTVESGKETKLDKFSWFIEGDSQKINLVKPSLPKSVLSSVFEVTIDGTIEEINPMGWIIIRDSERKPSWIYFTHMKFDKNDPKLKLLRKRNLVTFLNVLPVSLRDFYAGYAFTIRSSFLLKSPAIDDEDQNRNNRKSLFSIPVLLRSRCTVYSVWVSRFLEKVRRCNNFSILSQATFLDIGELLLVRFEEVFSFANNFGSKEQKFVRLEIERNVELEFSHDLFYDLFVARAGEDNDYLSLFLPRLVSVHSCRERAIAAAAVFSSAAISHSASFSFSVVKGERVLHLSDLIYGSAGSSQPLPRVMVVGQFDSIKAINGVFYLCSSDAHHNRTTFSLLTGNSSYGYIFQHESFYRSISSLLEKKESILFFAENPLICVEVDESNPCRPDFCSPSINLLSVKNLLLFHPSLNSGPLPDSQSNNHRPNCLESVRNIFLKPSTSPPERIVGVVIRKEIIIAEHNNLGDFQQTNSFKRIHSEAFSDRPKKFLITIRDIKTADSIGIYIGKEQENFADPSLLFPGMIIEITGFRVIVSMKKGKAYLVFEKEEKKKNSLGKKDL
jgi:hypothetical protein